MNVKLSKNQPTPHITHKNFPIVGIGASAGGLEALEQFFDNMPIDTGMAFVVVTHLNPNHVGMMPELLQRITKMKVIQAADNIKVKPNGIYVIPPNKSLSILSGTLHLFDPVESRGFRLPIDIFLRSLALDRKDMAIGVILSGMGSDGSLGVKAIKENNGIVLVQEPSSAKFDAMPRNAIEAVNVDIVAPANELPEKLTAYNKFIPNENPLSEKESRIKSNLDKIIILLKTQSGNDFSLYKKNTLFRRIERRKGVHQIDNIQTYVRFLQENPKEVEILFKELLIGVTSFFRDPIVWEKLKYEILPGIFNDLPDGYILRAWVPACSTGEEAYSWAMIFMEAKEKIKKKKKLFLQIFATDLDNDAIDKARKGFFPANIVADVSPERMNRFFVSQDDGYRVNSSIREMVIFAPQNVIKDPPFTKLDIISCRNMLIYMEPKLQKKLISLFNYSLIPGGILVLGNAETIDNQYDGFEILDNKLKIYKRTIRNSANELYDFPSAFYQQKIVTTERKKHQKGIDNIQTLADQIILQTYSPASVLVNGKGDILYITGRTGKYLEPVAGKANWNIYAMAREGLNHELPGAIRKAMENFEPVIMNKIKVGTNGGTQLLRVTIQQIEKPLALRGMVMLVFSDLPDEDEYTDHSSDQTASSRSKRKKEDDLKLQRCLEESRILKEEMQTSQEELKSTNEELQSTNEELQSTNEELTTSKEEMQSLNEELQTVNIELQSKVSEFVQAESDMKNLLNSTEIATLFLDRKLNIRRYTDAVINLFKLRKTDIGRPFTDLVSELEYQEIGNHAEEVLKSLKSYELASNTKDGRWYNVRIMPYRTFDDYIDGLVITFVDITVAKKLEMELKKANEILKKEKKDV